MTFIKRLVNNELGRTGGHQRGGVLIPRTCTEFFPTLGPPPNPETRIMVYFLGRRTSVQLRVIYYQQRTRNEYRITPVPHDVLRGAQAGDYFILQEKPDGSYLGAVGREGDSIYLAVRADVGRAVGRVTPKDYLPVDE